jgi:hypothetical protein
VTVLKLRPRWGRPRQCWCRIGISRLVDYFAANRSARSTVPLLHVRRDAWSKGIHAPTESNSIRIVSDDSIYFLKGDSKQSNVLSYRSQGTSTYTRFVSTTYELKLQIKYISTIVTKPVCANKLQTTWVPCRMVEFINSIFSCWNMPSIESPSAASRELNVKTTMTMPTWNNKKTHEFTWTFNS